MATGTFPYAKRRSFWRPFLAGVAAPNREGGFVGAFKAGLGGAFAQNAADEAAAQAAADEELKRQMEERLFGLKERETAAEEQRAAADMARAQREPAESRAYAIKPWYLDPAVANTPEAIAARKHDESLGGTTHLPQFSARDRALIAAYKKEHPKATDDEAVLAINSGQFAGRPVVTESESQARDDYGAPLYIRPDGRVTTEPQDKKTGVLNKPMMTRTKKYFGNPWGGDPLEGMIREGQ